MSGSSGEVYINNWIGGFIFWMLSGFRGKYSGQLTEKHLNRNVWTSYILQIGSIALILYFSFKKN